jgi:thiopurine S-methyltransferase
VEFVEMACRAFFDEHDVIPRIEDRKPFKVFAAAAIELWCGDIFDATPDRLGLFDAIYDRAALIALVPNERKRYVATLTKLLKPGGRIFLIGFRYDQSKVDGPPWSLEDKHVHELFLRDFVIEPLDSRPGHASPRLSSAGVTHFEENAYRLTELRKRTDERARSR